MKLWMQRADGEPSASITFATVGFAVITLWLILSIFGKIGPITIRPFSSGDAMAYLTPILALYFGRRWNDSQTSVTTAQLIGSNPAPGVVGLRDRVTVNVDPSSTNGS